MTFYDLVTPNLKPIFSAPDLHSKIEASFKQKRRKKVKKKITDDVWTESEESEPEKSTVRPSRVADGEGDRKMRGDDEISDVKPQGKVSYLASEEFKVPHVNPKPFLKATFRKKMMINQGLLQNRRKELFTERINRDIKQKVLNYPLVHIEKPKNPKKRLIPSIPRRNHSSLLRLNNMNNMYSHGFQNKILSSHLSMNKTSYKDTTRKNPSFKSIPPGICQDYLSERSRRMLDSEDEQEFMNISQIERHLSFNKMPEYLQKRKSSEEEVPQRLPEMKKRDSSKNEGQGFIKFNQCFKKIFKNYNN
ncbi:unnamed protein product [Moneuplotes crassus]|uniref:Uncharacterized protein n=1 Tax=Euplotes crassus TaxID=5936 RepID=A0AAD1U4R1_EUPCR|nr:unnamed protein product [Moneuplotes crassus]